MSLESKPRRRPLFLCTLLATAALCALAGAEARAVTKKADLRVCLTEPVEGANITLTKDGAEVLKLKQEEQAKDCYSKTRLNFDDTKTYGLLVTAPGYKENKTEKLDFSTLVDGGKVEPPKIMLEKMVTPGVLVCVKGQDGIPVTNASVVLKDEVGPHEVRQEEQQPKECYRNGEVILDRAKHYELLIKADGYKDFAQQLDLSKVGPGNSTNVVLERAPQRPPNPWPTWLLIAAIVVPFLAVFGALLFWWKRRHRPPVIANLPARPEVASAADTGALAAQLQSLVPPLQGIMKQQELQTKLLERVVELLDVREQERAEERRRAEAAANREPPRSALVSDVSPVPKPGGEQLARFSYANFLRGNSVTPDPIFLSAEGGNSTMDPLGTKPVILEHNPQGALVLFRAPDGDESGWVYPNTQLHYREEALRKVFPTLKEDQFKILKENRSPEGSGVEPVPVSKLDGSRWQVATR
jgi:hypothetical protein